MTAPQPSSLTRWERRYVASVVFLDLVCLIVADLAVTFGYHAGLPYGTRSMLIIVAMPVLGMGALAIERAWDRCVLGAGVEEYRRVIRGYVLAVAVMAVLGYAWGTSSGQSWVFGALPLAAVFNVAARYGMRRVVRRRRQAGRCSRSVLAVGTIGDVHEIVCRAGDITGLGWNIDGICLTAAPGDPHPVVVEDVPVLGGEDDIVDLVGRHRFHAVALLPSSSWDRSRIRQLCWDLEETGTELLMAPVLMDLIGPRLHITPIASMPLLQVSAPHYSGPAWVVKNVFDRLAAFALVLLLLPVLAAIAVAIRLNTPGPALFRQTRVGRDGRTFTMYKFRSMVVDAEQHLDVLASANDGAGVLFKMRADPRVTKVGAFLRKYSLDELPQLFNVVAGDMSLVGPRPPLESEVVRYGEDGARRRLFVKPGLTGLWQISGRSDMDWDESIRADLRYVENWKLTLDLAILWRTIGAVLRGSGAY
ncbi:sugar transferase [Rhodococcus sp. (in: high G+C Gram-positive bacteria)]|uniref:sugar transferase n=1 Tax=Rhodococcus sp. TaxID=1831 RepID=UPI003BB4914C